MCTPSFMRKFPFRGRGFVAERDPVPYAGLRPPGHRGRWRTQPMPTAPAPALATPARSASCASRSSACRVGHPRSDAGRGAREPPHHRRRLHRRRGRRVSDARRPPPRRAHQLPLLRALLGPLHARARRRRRGHRHELATLVALLRGSLLDEERVRSRPAIDEHAALLARHRRAAPPIRAASSSAEPAARSSPAASAPRAGWGAAASASPRRGSSGFGQPARASS